LIKINELVEVKKQTANEAVVQIDVQGGKF
jgi:hypothetical protein